VIKITTGKEIINALKGREDFDIQLDVKYMGRSVTLSDGDIEFDMIDDYKKGFLVLDAKGLNKGYTFDDGKTQVDKKKRGGRND